MYLARLARIFWCLPLSLLLYAAPVRGQSAADAAPWPAPVSKAAACDEAPREDATALLCAWPSSVEEARAADVARLAAATIPLTLEKGTPLRIKVDQRTRISRAGEAIHGQVVETVYAFDQQVIPAGSVASGHVKNIAPVPGPRRGMAYANGDFSPFHRYEVTFDMVTLPNGTMSLIAPIECERNPRTSDYVKQLIAMRTPIRSADRSVRASRSP